MAKNPQIIALENAMHEIQRAAQSSIPRAVARMAAEHFQENFRRGGFVNNGLQKWKDVKRRDPTSTWYGFEYKGEKRTYYRFSRDRKTGKTFKAAKQKKLNFSPTATRRDVLTSKRNLLMNSIKPKVSDGSAMVVSAAPHAKIHNEGGAFKVFGRGLATMAKRQFIGESKELTIVVEKYIAKAINDIFKQNK